MRSLLPILALTALGLASPAWADVTARYAGAGKYTPTMSIAIDESGQVRAEGGPPNQPNERIVLITRNGVSYLSAADAQGRFVGRQDDLVAIANDAIRTAIGTSRRDQAQAFVDMRIDIREGGMETVAGRQGRVYLITPVLPEAAQPPAAAPRPHPAGLVTGLQTEPAQGDPDMDAEPEGAQAEPSTPEPLEIVISDDPELAPIGREISRLFNSGVGLIETALGTVPPMVGQMQQLLARGTPLRFADAFRLRSVSTDPIPDSAFELPGPVLTRAQLAARLPQPPSAQRRPRTPPPPVVVVPRN